MQINKNTSVTLTVKVVLKRLFILNVLLVKEWSTTLTFSTCIFLFYKVHNNTVSMGKWYQWRQNSYRSSITLINIHSMKTCKKSSKTKWSNILLILTKPKPLYWMIFVVQFTWCSFEVYKLRILQAFMTVSLWWKCSHYRNKFNKQINKLVYKLNTGFKALWKHFRLNLITFSRLKIWKCVQSLFISTNICIGLYKMQIKKSMHIKPLIIERLESYKKQ